MSAAGSPSGENEDKTKKSFVCSSPGCNQRFSSAEKLSVHKQKHQMTLKLGTSNRNLLQDVLPVDQTPTPTRFLHLGNQIGLFEDLKENPFDREFNKSAKEGGVTPKQRRTASVVQQLQLMSNNHKSKTPTTPTWPATLNSTAGVEATSSQPVHVITLTPTLPSPGLLSATGPYFIPPLLPSPSIPGYSATSPMQVPATLLSPTLMPFAPGFLPSPMMADHQRAFAQAMFAAAAASAGTSPLATTVVTASSSEPSTKNSQESVAARPDSTTGNLERSQQQAMYSDATSSQPSVFQQPHATSVITQVPNQMEGHYHNAVTHPAPYSIMPDAPSESKSMANIKGSMVAMATGNHSSMSGSTQLPSVSSLTMQSHHQNVTNQHSLSRTSSSEFGSNSNLAEAKQKLKETLTSNNPNLQQVIAAEAQRKMSSSSESGTMTSHSMPGGDDSKPVPRRRGRQQQDIDPDIKRQRFLERNRAAASRCRNKKKKWVSGLEVKAKGLTNLNVQLQNEIASLKDEIASLKQLLLSHRDCPVTKMQQQSMAMAGINLNTLEPSTPSTLNNLDAIVKSESPGSSAGESTHPNLTATYSTGSVEDGLQGSNPNIAMQAASASQDQLTNGRGLYPNINTSSTATT